MSTEPEVSKFETSRLVREEQPKNIWPNLYTLDVLNLLTSKLINDQQFPNIFVISVTFDVLKPDTSRLVTFLHS